MRIAHFLQQIRLDAGGTMRAVVDICTRLTALGHQILLISADDADVPEPWRREHGAARGDEWPREGRIRSVRIPSIGKLGWLAPDVRAQVTRYVSSADVLHGHALWNLSTLQVCLAARREGTPYVVSAHGMLDDWCMSQRRLKKKAFLAVAGRGMLESAAAVHCTAEAELDQARQWFPRGHGVVIPNLLDLDPFRELPGPALAREAYPGLTSGNPSILFLSRIHEKKGIESLLKAATEVPRAEVYIAGTGDPAYVESLKTLARTLGIAPRTHFLGLVGGDLKLSLYEAADLFVLPTLQENFGFVFYESLACATPLITTKGVDTWPELELSGGARIIGNRPGELGGVIRAMLADRPRLRVMGDAGRRWVFRELDPDRILRRFEAMYDAALATRAS